MIEALTELAQAGMAGVAITGLYLAYRTSNGAMKLLHTVVRNNTTALLKLRGTISVNHSELVKLLDAKNGGK